MKLDEKWALCASPARIAEWLSEGAWRAAPHHELISQVIASAVLDGDGRYLIQTPPQHGKSLLCAHWGMVWALHLDRSLRVGVASYEARIASGWGRMVRNTATAHAGTLNFRLAPDSKAADVWHTDDPQGHGGMITCGIGGALTGRRLNLLVIDDPVKNADVARSQVYRDSHWEWWTMTAQSRLAPGASVIVVQTRWHEDDLSGRLENEGGWRIIRLPALAEKDDILGREEGEALWPSEYPADCLKFEEARRHPRSWASLYQQRPSPEEGAVFQRAHFRYYRETIHHFELIEPDGAIRRIFKPDVWTAQTCDTALKIGTLNDFTVVLTFSAGDRCILLRDVYRDQVEVPDQWAMLRQQRRKWPGLVCQAVEDRASGVGLIQQSIRDGQPLKPLKPDVDKVTRAVPLSVAYESGMVYHPIGATWLDAFESELLAFPAGAHDDQVDCAAYAAMLVQEIGVRTAMPIEEPEDDAEEMADVIGANYG